MKKIIVLLVVIGSSFMIVGCGDKKKNNENVIALDSKVYVSQLKEITIEGTKDYFIITEKSSLDSNLKGSWNIAVPYKIHVDDVDYQGTCILGSSGEKCTDDNPKYKVKLSNLKNENNNDYAEVLITKK